MNFSRPREKISKKNVVDFLVIKLELYSIVYTPSNNCEDVKNVSKKLFENVWFNAKVQTIWIQISKGFGFWKQAIVLNRGWLRGWFSQKK
jgi:hypothetical protein